MRPTLLTPFRVLWRRRMLERSCRLTRAELERDRARRLAALRRFVIGRSPFYGEFHRGHENRPLDALPILSKAQMMERFDDLVTDRDVRLADAESYLCNEPGDDLFRQR